MSKTNEFCHKEDGNSWSWGLRIASSFLRDNKNVNKGNECSLPRLLKQPPRKMINHCLKELKLGQSGFAFSHDGWLQKWIQLLSYFVQSLILFQLVFLDLLPNAAFSLSLSQSLWLSRSLWLSLFLSVSLSLSHPPIFCHCLSGSLSKFAKNNFEKWAFKKVSFSSSSRSDKEPEQIQKNLPK